LPYLYFFRKPQEQHWLAGSGSTTRRQESPEVEKHTLVLRVPGEPGEVRVTVEVVARLELTIESPRTGEKVLFRDLEVKGSLTGGSARRVTLSVNERRINLALSNRRFSKRVQLREGWNEITAAVGQVQRSVRVHLKACALEVTQPRGGATLDSDRITVTGCAGAGASTVTITVNGASRSAGASGGRFDVPVTLRQGSNVIEVAAAGQTRRLTVKYTPVPIRIVRHALDTPYQWLRCPIGMRWSGVDCVGTPRLFGQGEIGSACPAGFRLPTINELKALLVNANPRISACGVSDSCNRITSPACYYTGQQFYNSGPRTWCHN
jgi:hypothetical protein